MQSPRTPNRIDVAGILLDVSRMKLPADLQQRYGALGDTAIRQMQDIERGEIVNVDEGWQVGHYWLRNPSLAPGDYADEIRAALSQIDAFARGPFLRFSNVLWIGIGGSGLGPQMLYDSLRRPGTTPRMFFFDNTDAYGFQRTLREIELEGGLHATLTVVVSKSGGTKETANGMRVAMQAYRKAGLKFEDHAVAITKPGSKLDRLAAGQDSRDDATETAWLARFPIWDWVGGRTSLFSSVGMLPAHLLGFDTDLLQRGAREMDDATRDASVDSNAALLLATTWYHAVETLGLGNMVVLPYADRMRLFSSYLQQLVMESLGKDGKGISVFGNKGSTDQHSYVQQLRDGRNDFFVTFLRVLDPEADDWEVEPGVTANDYLMAFQEGTAQALDDAGRLSLTMTLERFDERSLGALLALFERTVGYYGAMIGINAYHQPGVEAGKRAAEDLLDLQRRTLDVLRQEPGREFTAAELADIVAGNVASDAQARDVAMERMQQQVTDLLVRFFHLGRGGVQLGVTDGTGSPKFSASASLPTGGEGV